MYKLTMNRFNEISLVAYDSNIIPIRKDYTKNENSVRSLSSLYRSKSVFLDYAKNNEFNYFMTITIDSKKKNLNNYEEIRKQILHYFNNFCVREDNDFKYIMVAELGKVNSRLHFHGLVYVNNEKKFLKHIRNGNYRNKFLFENIGANQFIKIDKYNVNCANYCVKYFTKENISFQIFKHAYYCSKGLERSRDITKEFEPLLISEFFKFVSDRQLTKDLDFCSVFSCNYEKFYEIINYLLTNSSNMNYYICASEDN